MTDHLVKEGDDDIRLDRWFKRHFPQLTHGFIEKSLRKGLIRVNAKKAKASDRLQTGHIIRMPDIAPSTSPLQGEGKEGSAVRNPSKIRDWVLYQDKEIIVINKPAGLAVQGGSKQRESIDGMLDVLRKPGEERPKLVHRLDKDTSGVLALAKNAKVAASLSQAFAKKDVEKIYWALVVGAPKKYSGTIDLPLAKLVQGKDSRERVAVEEDGKRAITEWRVIEALGQKLAWMELRPITGRTHQLRVHLPAIGHPILGDGKYGGSAAFIPGLSQQLHLHARKLILPSGSGKRIEVEAPLPEHMQESWELLGLTNS